MNSENKNLMTGNAAEFREAITIIERSRERAFRAVNSELISMYWEIGRYISEKVSSAGWGKSVVAEFAKYIQSNIESSKGFSPQNIWRMKQFFETYHGNEKLSALLREISWTNNLMIMSRSRSDEEREFYLLLCAKNAYSSRELTRQIDSCLFERTMISTEKNQLFLERNAGLAALRDSYVLEFLDIPEHHKEKELRKAIIANLRNF